MTTLDRAAPGEEGRATSALQLCDVLGQAIGTGVAGAIVAAAARIGHRPGVALAFSFAIAVALIGVIVGARLPVSSLPSTCCMKTSGRICGMKDP